MQPLAIVVGVVVAAAALLLFVGLGRTIQSAETLEERLAALTPESAGVAAPSEAGASQTQASAPSGALARIARRQSIAESMSAELARANVPLKVWEYTLLRTATAAVMGLAVMVLLRQLWVAIVCAVVGLFVPGIFLKRREEKRRILFHQQLPHVLTLLVGSLRSGYGMTIAMSAVAQQMPAPSSEEFKRVVTETGLGVPLTGALANLVRRIRSDDLDLIATAITIQYEVGGNLAEILETITETIRERIRLKEQMRVLTAQARLQRTILTLLPFALGVVMYIMNPEYVRHLFDPGLTLILPVAGIVLMILGYIVMGRLSQLEV
jgi:tight adherence protein B